MPDVRFGIDAGPAQEGARQVASTLRGMVEEFRKAQAEIDRIRTGGAASPQAIQAAQQQARATEEQAKATQNLAAAQKDQFATADRVLRTKREELNLRARLIKGLRDEDAATRRAAQAALTALSTLGGANRALSQRIVFEDRLRKAIEAGLVTEKEAIEIRKQAAVQFSTAAVKARDLRTNIAGLNQSVALIASTMGRFNPLLGVMASSALRAGNAISKLGGGFILLGPMLGALTGAAAAMTAIAVAGDRTGRIPSTFRQIVGGAGELVKQLSDAWGVSKLLLVTLEAIRDLLPTPQSRVQAAQARLEAAQALPVGGSSGKGRAGVEFGISNEAARLREIAAAEKELAEARSAARAAESVEVNKLIRNLDRETAARIELKNNIQKLQIALAQKLITEEEYQRLLGVLNEEERKRVEGLNESTKAVARAQREEDKRRAAIEAAAVAEADRLDDLRFQNELLEKEIEATKQGAEALRQWQVEKAAQIELRRQERLYQEQGIELSKEESDALIEAARRNADLQKDLQDLKKPKDAVVQYEDIWGRAIENIQRGFGDLFTDVIANGKDAFNNFGSFLKQMFARVAGEIANVLVFKPLFAGLTGALVPGAAGASTGGGKTTVATGQISLEQSNFLSQLGTTITSGVTKALSGIGSIFGGGGGAAAASSGVQTGFFIPGTLSYPQGLGSSGAFFGASKITSFTPLQGGLPQGYGTGVPQAGGGLSLGGGSAFGGIGQAFGGIGGVLASIPITDRIIDKLKLSNDTKLERIAQYAGGIVGGLVGSYFTGGSSIGGLVGGIAGGTAAVGQAQVIQALSSGSRLFEAPNRLQAANRGAAIGGPIGTLIGFLLYDKIDTNVDIQTRRTLGELQAIGLQGGGGAGAGITRESPFGFIGFAGAGTGGDVSTKVQRSILDAIAAIDSTMVQYLTRTEREILKAANLSQFHSNVRNSAKIVTARIGNILSTLGLPQGTINQALTGSAEEQIQQASDLLAARREVVALVEELRGTAQATTDAEKALEQIQLTLDDIALRGPALGVVVDDIEQLRQVAVQKLTEAFELTINDSILALTDPASLAADEIARQQEKRLAEAAALSADLVEVERLNLLERQNLLKQINDPIKSLVDAINLSPSGSSPTIALATAESRFFEIAGGLQAKTGAFTTQDLSAAAQSFLGLGEQFLGGPTFAAQRENVLSVLESFLLSDLPGTTNTQGQLQSLTLETARGNAITEQLLQELVDSNEAQASEIAQLREQLERLLAR